MRVICATHRTLSEIVDRREFRADLFYRLNVFPIELPPRRERPGDIRVLVHHFVIDYAARVSKPITAISEEFIAALVRYSWPGNVREPQNWIERSVILATGEVLHGSVPESIYSTQADWKWPKLSGPRTSHAGRCGSFAILQSLEKAAGVIRGPNGAAARLGLPRTTFNR